MIKKVSSVIFKTLILSLMLIADLHFAFAQSTQQGIIPNGKATFLDQNGKPLTAGTVDFYIPGTTTRKTTYQDINGTTPNTNPVVLDAAGRALIWGTGNYRQVVKDKNSNLIWDVTTSASGSSSGGGGGTATGDGDLVGTIKPWAGMSAPNQYLFTYGQELSRTTYATLFNAITSTQSVFCTTGSNVLTGLGDTTNFWIGMKVEVSCVPAGVSTVTAKTSSSVTLAVTSNITTNTNALFFSWGNGNGSTTFNLPDFRGVVPVGNNIMGGVASSNLNTTYFGATNPNSSGALGGSQSNTLIVGNLPPYTPAGVIPNIPITVSTGGGLSLAATNGTITGSTFGSGGFGVVPITNTSWFAPTSLTGTATATFNGTAQGGTSAPFSVIQPSRTVNYIIKTTPDANSATANGVTDINGMTGSIGCGSGLICTGNVISVNINTTTGNVVSYTTRLVAAAATIPITVSAIYVNGFTTSGDGGAGQYIKLASAPTPRLWNFQSADGAWWQLTTSHVKPKQVGAACDGVTDDSTPAQAWVDYSSTFGAQSFGQLCNMAVPTALINLPSKTDIQGLKQVTITRTTDVVMQLLQATNADRVSVKGLNIVCQCGFTSSTSNTIGTGTKTFTVPAGLNLSTVAPNNNIQIIATNSPLNYLISQITAYSGTTLTINTVSGNAVGSGTFNAWTLASYPVNGDIAPVPAGLSFVGCTNSTQEDNIVSGPFYDGIDNRNGNNEVVAKNTVLNWINRGIHEAAYLNTASQDIHIVDNTLIGSGISEYAINTSGTDGATIQQMTIRGNTIRGTVGQGVNTSGQLLYTTVVGNTVIMPSGVAQGVGFLVENIPGSIPQRVTLGNNTVTGGAQGIFVSGASYVDLIGNNITNAGTGIFVAGTSTAGQTNYINITGNTTNSGTTTGGLAGHGISIAGGVAGGVTGVTITGNHSIGNSGNGFIVDSTTNSTNVIFGGGNQAIANTGTGYNVGGVTTVPAATNQ